MQPHSLCPPCLGPPGGGLSPQMRARRPPNRWRFARNASAKLEVDEAPAPTVASADGATRGCFPLEASVRCGWRESSKRSSASAGAGAPFRGLAITPARGRTRVLAVGCDHPAIRGAVIAFVTERSCRRRAWLLLLGDSTSGVATPGWEPASRSGRPAAGALGRGSTRPAIGPETCLSPKPCLLRRPADTADA